MYAVLKGGQAERIGATILVLGSILTGAVQPHWYRDIDIVEIEIFVVDSVGFAAFIALALCVNRFWPIWVAAMLGLGVLGHVAQWYAGPDLNRWAYVVSLTIWTYPMLAALAIGTFNHQRRTAGHPGGLAAER